MPKWEVYPARFLIPDVLKCTETSLTTNSIVQEMNSLEVEFLFLTNFSLFVTYDTYKQYHTELRNHAMHSSCEFPELADETSKKLPFKQEEKSEGVSMMQTESPQMTGKSQAQVRKT